MEETMVHPYMIHPNAEVNTKNYLQIVPKPYIGLF